MRQIHVSRLITKMKEGKVRLEHLLIVVYRNRNFRALESKDIPKEPGVKWG